MARHPPPIAPRAHRRPPRLAHLVRSAIPVVGIPMLLWARHWPHRTQVVLWCAWLLALVMTVVAIVQLVRWRAAASTAPEQAG